MKIDGASSQKRKNCYQFVVIFFFLSFIKQFSKSKRYQIEVHAYVCGHENKAFALVPEIRVLFYLFHTIFHFAFRVEKDQQ